MTPDEYAQMLGKKYRMIARESTSTVSTDKTLFGFQNDFGARQGIVMGKVKNQLSQAAMDMLRVDFHGWPKTPKPKND